MIGVLGWAVILVLGVALEAVALTSGRDRWPSLSDLAAVVTRSVPGRWVLFAVWLWFGWHLFVRGWRFFLQESPHSDGSAQKLRATGLLPAAPPDVWEWLRDDVAPLVFLYGLAIALLVFGVRQLKAASRPAPRSAGGVSGYVRHLVVTVPASYAGFVGVLGLYDLMTSQGGSLVKDAIGGGAFLLAVTIPVFTLLSALQAAVRKGRSP